MTSQGYYLPTGMPIPAAEADGLSRPYWEGLRGNQIRVQRCKDCAGWQWGPEWICHRCLSFNLDWETVSGQGRIYSWERSWHPVHPALRERCPYLAVLVELPEADNIRMLGNLLGDPRQAVEIGREVVAVFEHHENSEPKFTLLQWQYA